MQVSSFYVPGLEEIALFWKMLRMPRMEYILVDCETFPWPQLPDEKIWIFNENFAFERKTYFHIIVYEPP